jgi:hypothetical protein
MGISGTAGLYGIRGRDGAKGRPGRDGRDGPPGKDGNDGQAGQDGTRIFVISDEVYDIDMLTNLIVIKYAVLPKMYDLAIYSVNHTIYEFV